MYYISVNSHKIRTNAKHGTNYPPIRVAKNKSDSEPRYAHEIKIIGDSKLLYNPNKPILKCGARLVIEASVVIIER